MPAETEAPEVPPEEQLKQAEKTANALVGMIETANALVGMIERARLIICLPVSDCRLNSLIFPQTKRVTQMNAGNNRSPAVIAQEYRAIIKYRESWLRTVCTMMTYDEQRQVVANSAVQPVRDLTAWLQEEGVWIRRPLGLSRLIDKHKLNQHPRAKVVIPYLYAICNTITFSSVEISRIAAVQLAASVEYLINGCDFPNPFEKRDEEEQSAVYERIFYAAVNTMESLAKDP